MKDLQFIVILPAYNAERTLERSVESITQQHYENYHLIIINDGSADKTADICSSLEQKYEQISVINQENQGGIVARANGIRYAKEHFDLDRTYFLFLDADDIFVEGSLARIGELITEGDDMLIFGLKKVDEKSGKTLVPMPGTYNGVVESKAELYRIVLFDYQYNSLCRKAVSSKLLGENSFGNVIGVSRGWDLVQSIEFYRNTGRTRFVNDILYIYYQNMESVTHTKIQPSSAVRKFVWDFVVAEDVWTDADYKKFSRYNCELLRKKIIAVCLIDDGLQRQTEYFEGFHNDSFYAQIVKANPDYDMIISLFARKKHRLLIKYVRARGRFIRLLGKGS